MKNKHFFTFLFIFLAMSLSGCEIVGDIFKAGFWMAFVLIAIVLAVVFWIVRKMRRPRP